jgi:glucose/arabinose dehydrogenase
MRICSLAALSLHFLVAAATLDAGESIGLELVNRATTPLYVTHAPGDRDHLFVAERAGRVRVLDLQTNEFLSEPLLDVGGQIYTQGEGGLLGLTFHPNFQENGQFFVYVSDDEFAAGFDHASYVRRYEVQDANPLAADMTTEATVLRFNQPQGNHNAGWIDFSPVDGYLYISSGDGGNGNDLGTNHTQDIGNAQDISDNWLGKMLRVDVNGDDFPNDDQRNYAVPPDNPFVDATGDDEIFAYGLRNPFRDGFDRANGDLYIGDVGQNNWEEIDFLPANSSGGQNFGWRLREGLEATPTPPNSPVGGPPPADNVDPIHVYGHVGAPNGGNSVTGGTVYRGPVAELQGKYLFADFGSNQIWSFHHDGTAVNDFENITAALRPPNTAVGGIVAFGEDAIGNVYIVEIGGRIWRITGDAAIGDFNRDALVDRADAAVLLEGLGTLTGATTEMGDADGDADVDGNDLKDLLLAFGTSALDVPAGTTAAALAAGAPSVPEPASAVLAVLGVATMMALLCFSNSASPLRAVPAPRNSCRTRPLLDLTE